MEKIYMSYFRYTVGYSLYEEANKNKQRSGTDSNDIYIKIEGWGMRDADDWDDQYDQLRGAACLEIGEMELLVDQRE